MNMFCYQCQETAGNKACSIRGVCGKSPETAGWQDIALSGVRVLARRLSARGTPPSPPQGRHIFQVLFATITNANFDSPRFLELCRRTLELLPEGSTVNEPAWIHQAGVLEQAHAQTEVLTTLSAAVGITRESDPTVRSLRELAMYGLKGVAAYGEHAAVLGFEDQTLYTEAVRILAALDSAELPVLLQLVMDCGNLAVQTMALLDQANTSTYGNPEVTKVNIGVGKRPGILISGHDLHDLEELLEQTKDSGIDVYTHSEMLAAHYYPKFKKYPHFVGNYGNAWWQQDKEFASFAGAILMTTNCIVPVRPEYADRIWTTGMAGYPSVPHIGPGPEGQKDFSALIAKAKTCPPPLELETGYITGGFAHQQVLALADKVVEAVKTKAIKKFVVMGGCDGRHKSRSYFTDLAQALPGDSVIMTAGCAKYRYNKLNLGEIGGIPRVLDAGQCNDSYSIAVIALKLKEVFGLEDVNQLPVDFAIAWYEQKAVAVLLALLALGFKNIRLGPSLPAFLSPQVLDVLVKNFGIKPTTTVAEDLVEIVS